MNDQVFFGPSDDENAGWLIGCAPVLPMSRRSRADAAERDQVLMQYRAARAAREPEKALGYLTGLLAGSPDDSGLVLDQAEILLELGRAEPAERICHQVLSRAPGDRRAHLALVQAARIRRDDALLHERLGAAFAALGPDGEMLIERGELHLARGEPDGAEDDFSAALALLPDSRRARLGLFHAGRGRVPPEREYERICAVIDVSDAADLALRLDRAEALIRLGEAEAAEADALSALAEHPADTRALTIMVQAGRIRRDPALLLERIEAARQAAPSHPPFGRELDWDRADALVTLGRAEAARPLLAQLADTDTDVHTRLRLGRLTRATGDRRGALTHFEAALAQAPDDAEALLDACTEMTALGMDRDAQHLAERLARLEGQAVAGHMACGFIFRQRGDRHAALACFRQALEAAPDHHGAALNAAAELAELGELAAAEALVVPIFERARDTDRDITIEALLRLAHIARLRPDRARALRVLQQARALDGDHPDMLLELAAECREQGRFDEAEAALERLGALRGRALSTLLARGHLARRRGARDVALRWYSEAHQAFPDLAEPLAEMAVEQRALNQPQDADHSLRRALGCEPGHTLATIRLAEQHLIAERYDACVATCAELRRRQPYVVIAWLVECAALATRDGVGAALALLDQAEEQLGAHPDVFARRIDLLRDVGDYPAIRRLMDLAARRAGHPRLWGSMARALLLFADISEIEAWFALAPASDIGTIAELEELKGRLAEAQWRPADALTHYRNALRIDPNRYPLEQDIARLCLVETDIDAAGTALQSYVRRHAGERRLRGESTKPSQTHVGQLLDEYRLDPDTVAALGALRSAPAAARIAGGCAIVGRSRDSTAAAVFLLMSLRAAGLFDEADRIERVAPAGEGTIPRRLVQFWFQAELPADIAGLMQTWQEHHPGWAYTRFDDAAAQQWLGAHHQRRVLDAYRRAPQKAQKADLFRLAWLSVEGGLYADADDRCLGPFDTWCTPGTELIAYQEDYGTLGNNILVCRPGHWVLRRALAMAVTAVLRGDSDLLWLNTGPGLLSRAFAQAVPNEADARATFIAGTRILDRRTIGRVMAMHCQARYKLTDNHWLQNLVK